MSFVAAARELNVTPAAVSKNIRGLEEQLGIQLFRRDHRRVTLTDAGAFYLDRIGDAFDQIDRATHALLERERRETLTICAFPSFVMRWLIPKWSNFKSAHPDIDVRYTTTLRPVDLDREDTVDAVILAEDRDFVGYTAEPLFETELMPVCSASLAAGPPPLRRPEDLATRTLIHAQTRPRDWERWLAINGISGVDCTRGLRVESTSIAYQSAIEGLGVAIGIRALIPQDLMRGLLVTPFGGWKAVPLKFCMAIPQRMAHSRSMHAFRDWMVREAAADRGRTR